MVKIVWLHKTGYGNFTIEQEFFCWRMALHGNQMKSVREAYSASVGNGNVQNIKSWKLMQKGKIIRHIKSLVAQHKKGGIDLREGPWKHYNRYDVGSPVDPGNRLTSMIQTIRDEAHGEDTSD
jgi:hypothetical protein